MTDVRQPRSTLTMKCYDAAKPEVRHRGAVLSCNHELKINDT